MPRQQWPSSMRSARQPAIPTVTRISSSTACGRIAWSTIGTSTKRPTSSESHATVLSTVRHGISHERSGPLSFQSSGGLQRGSDTSPTNIIPSVHNARPRLVPFLALAGLVGDPLTPVQLEVRAVLVGDEDGRLAAFAVDVTVPEMHVDL